MFHRIGCIALLIAVAVPGYAQTNTVEEWRKQVSLRLSSSKRFPPGAFDQNGTARVDFVLDRHGKLVSHWLVESTGHRALDEESLAIIERAQPFPIPPPDLDEGGLRMGVPFVFSARSARHRDSGPDIRNNNPAGRSQGERYDEEHLPRLLTGALVLLRQKFGSPRRTSPRSLRWLLSPSPS